MNKNELAKVDDIKSKIFTIKEMQVRQNLNRFPKDFSFQLSKEEWLELVTNCDNLGAYKYSPSLSFASVSASLLI
ncbi:MAG: hypothetical protein ACOX2F_08565 [bacterium]